MGGIKKSRRRRGWPGGYIGCLMALTLALVLIAGGKAWAIEISIGERPLILTGYANQGISYGLSGDDHYDVQGGFQQAIFQGLLEARYDLHPDFRLFASGKINADWSYVYLSGDSDWEAKGFDQSKDKLAFFDSWDDLLCEAHVTWTPGNFIIRLGKQIVKWGETDAVRITDQINPVDGRRGITDVEFETTIIPITLAKVSYFIQPNSSWLQDVQVEGIFNPNVNFRYNEGVTTGNESMGIWAPNIVVPLGGAYPKDYAHYGEGNLLIEEPDTLDSDGFEYGLRLRTVIMDSVITMMYFYGRDNSPAATTLGSSTTISPWDGRLVIQPNVKWTFPLYRFLGATFTRDLPSLTSSFLGGVAPTIRLEAMYGINNTYLTSTGTLEERDDFRWGAAVDWKVDIPFLNPKAYFSITGQLFGQHFRDYPSFYDLSAGEEDNYQATLYIGTSYLHNKLSPSVFYWYDITNEAQFIQPKLTYDYDHNWSYALSAVFFMGNEQNKSFALYENKNMVTFTVSYNF